MQSYNHFEERFNRFNICIYVSKDQMVLGFRLGTSS